MVTPTGPDNLSARFTLPRSLQEFSVSGERARSALVNKKINVRRVLRVPPSPGSVSRACYLMGITPKMYVTRDCRFQKKKTHGAHMPAYIPQKQINYVPPTVPSPSRLLNISINVRT